MATLYVKYIPQVIVSENSDFSKPLIDTSRHLAAITKTLSTTGYAEVRMVRAETGGTTIDTGLYDTLDLFQVVNLDPTNEVDVAWTDGDANANTQVIEPGSFPFEVNDVVGSTDPTLTAQTADCDCIVVLAGVRA